MNLNESLDSIARKNIVNELRFSKAKLAIGVTRENGAVGLLMRPKGNSKEAVIISAFLKITIHTLFH